MRIIRARRFSNRDWDKFNRGCVHCRISSVHCRKVENVHDVANVAKKFEVKLVKFEYFNVKFISVSIVRIFFFDLRGLSLSKFGRLFRLYPFILFEYLICLDYRLRACLANTLTIEYTFWSQLKKIWFGLLVTIRTSLSERQVILMRRRGERMQSSDIWFCHRLEIVFTGV